MPNCTHHALSSRRAVQQTAEYPLDEKHENHIGYKITPIQPTSPADFAGSCEHDLAAVNRDLGPSNQAKVEAYWLIVGFERGAHLNGPEKAQVAEKLKEGFGPGFGVWHENQFTGASDYNLLLPGVIDGPEPMLRRWLGTKPLEPGEKIMNGVIAAINHVRETEGRPKLRDLVRV